MTCFDGRKKTSALCYTRVRSELNLRFMRRFALRPSVPRMQTLADMAEMQTAGGPHRVLVATESVAGDASLVGLLKHGGFEAMTAVDGQEALQIAHASWQPDVVLLEQTLPTLDALSICDRLRATNQRAVILVLGGDSRQDEVRSLEAGADDYVAKPFSPEVLLARIRAHLRTRRSAGNQRIPSLGIANPASPPPAGDGRRGGRVSNPIPARLDRPKRRWGHRARRHIA